MAMITVPIIRSNSWQFSDTSLSSLFGDSAAALLIGGIPEADCSSSSSSSVCDSQTSASSSSSSCSVMDVPQLLLFSDNSDDSASASVPASTATTTAATTAASTPAGGLALPALGLLPCLTPNSVGADLGALAGPSDWDKLQMFPMMSQQQHPNLFELQQQQQQQVQEIQQSLMARRTALMNSSTTAAMMTPHTLLSGTVPSANSYHARARNATARARKSYIEMESSDQDDEDFKLNEEEDGGDETEDDNEAGDANDNDDIDDIDGGDDAQVPNGKKRSNNNNNNGCDDDQYKPSRKGKCKPCSWSEDLLKMSTRDLNRYLKSTLLSKAEVADLKAARRRAKNRVYARLSRQRRLKKYDALSNDVSKIQDAKQNLNAQLARMKQEYELAMATATATATATAVLQDGGFQF